MAKRTTDADLDLLGALGVDTSPAKPIKRSAKEQRIIAGFEEIERFVEEQGGLPQHGENRDIFERLYAVRLDRLRESEECRELLQPLDARGILAADSSAFSSIEEMSDEDLLAVLGVETSPKDDIERLAHVRSRREKAVVEEVAQRTPCEDFDQFKPVFETIQHELKTGKRQTVRYEGNAGLNRGDLFIIDGQKAMVVEEGEPFVSDYGRSDRRLRVVYDNGTESDLLLRSLQRALHRDKASRRITKPDFGPLFSQIDTTEESTSGTVYVLRSNSDNPFIAENRLVIHKIGVTTGNVKNRIANAQNDPTYLLAEVEVVATFALVGFHPQKLEALLQKFFASARLDVELMDRFDVPVKPKEWFWVPLSAIEEAIEKIEESTLDQFRYDTKQAALVRC